MHTIHALAKTTSEAYCHCHCHCNCRGISLSSDLDVMHCCCACRKLLPWRLVQRLRVWLLCPGFKKIDLAWGFGAVSPLRGILSNYWDGTGESFPEAIFKDTWRLVCLYSILLHCTYNSGVLHCTDNSGLFFNTWKKMIGFLHIIVRHFEVLKS